MQTLTIKISPSLKQALEQASARSRLSKSEVARQALAAFLMAPAEGEVRAASNSALARAGELVGCFKGGPKDLASNPRHLEGFGR